jgi:ArsR family transcriptional regulator
MSQMTAAQIDVRPISRLFKALGDETRLRIVALLSHGELCVCHIEDALAISQPNASRHLGILRNAGIVEPRRNGNWVYYRLVEQTEEECRRHMKTLVEGFSKQARVRGDVERLLKVKGPGACP